MGIKNPILKKYSDNYFITKVLRYTFDSFKKYNVTSPALKKRKDLCENPGYYDLFYLLDALDSVTISSSIVRFSNSLGVITHSLVLVAKSASTDTKSV